MPDTRQRDTPRRACAREPRSPPAGFVPCFVSGADPAVAAAAAPVRAIASASVHIARNPLDVWRFISAAETMPLIDHEVLSGAHMPGTPHGVGQIQVLVRQGADGIRRGSMLEVLEWLPPRLAAYRHMGGEQDLPTGGRVDITPTDGGGALVTHT